MRKRLLSLALALALCLGLTVPAAAAGATFKEIMSADTYDSFCDWAGYTINGFHEGVTWRGQGGHGYGTFDTEGNIIIPPHSYSINASTPTDFSEGVAWARKDNRWYAVDITGKELFALDEELSIDSTKGTSDFHEGLAKVENKETKKYGFVDKTGKMVIPAEYSYYSYGVCEFDEYGDKGRPFHDGLTVVYDSANAYYGYMDKTGKMVIPYQYANASSFKNGVARVKLGDRWTVIDTTGKDLLPQAYSSAYDAEHISSEVFAVKGPNGDYGFANKAGQIVSEGYSSIEPFSNGMALVGKGGYGTGTSLAYGYVNEAGVLVVPCQYSGGNRAEADFIDGYAVIHDYKDNVHVYNIIDKTGKVTGSIDGYIRNLGNGCFWIGSSESGRARDGFIDCTGREIVSPKYKTIKEFSGGVAAVQNFDEKWGFVDTTGAEIVPCKLKWVEYTNEPGIFVVNNYNDDGRASIIKSSGWTEPAVSGSTPSTPAKPAGPSANPTNSKVLVNGKEVAFDAYTIDGSNYFKLRDLAYVLNGTEKQFEVGWDNASKTITLTSGSAYTANGSEMAKGSGAQNASVSASKLLIDGKEVSLTAYTIGGNNYFKLRDIGQAFDFGIGWDNASKTITIDTSAGYTA